MTDIVERLRDKDGLCAIGWCYPIVMEAADEIERLREWKRMAQEDIITLGQMVGRHCPLCAALSSSARSGS